MYPVFLSDAERTFIWDGVEVCGSTGGVQKGVKFEIHHVIFCSKVNLRCDGRKRSDYRPMELETDVVTHANGSARLRLANTDILVGVKTEIDVPLVESPNLGKLEFFVDWYSILFIRIYVFVRTCLERCQITAIPFFQFGERYACIRR